MNTHDVPSPSRRGEQADVYLWVLVIPIVGTLNVALRGGSGPEIGLTFLSGLVLGSVLGLRQLWANRHHLEHEQSHIKLTVITTVIVWTAFVAGAGVAAWARGKADRQLLVSVIFLLTAGQFFIVLVGAGWGIALRTLDWYPLRRTQASTVRLVVLYLAALALVVASSVLMLNAPRWQWFLALTGIALVWLAMARLWRG